MNYALNKHFARHYLKYAQEETLYSNLNEYQWSKLLDKSKMLQNSLLSKENFLKKKMQKDKQWIKRPLFAFPCLLSKSIV